MPPAPPPRILTSQRRRRRDRLIESHLHLVAPIASRIHAGLPASFDLLDLASAGTMGLIDAAERNNCSGARDRKAMFTSYARHKIRGAMLDSIRRGKFLDATHQPIEAAIRIKVEPSAPHDLQRAERKRAICAAFRSLSQREARLLYSRYWEGSTLAEIAAEMGISKTVAGRLHRQALAKIEQSLLASPASADRTQYGRRRPLRPPLVETAA